MQRFALLLTCAILPLQSAFAQTDSPPPERPFTLLMIYDEANPRAAVPLWEMCARPKSKEMQRWSTWATPKRLTAQSSIVRDHHADILRDATGLPALALVDSAGGGRWHLISGQSIPETEYELARELDVYYAATMDAAKTAALQPGAIQTIRRDQLDNFRRGSHPGYSDTNFDRPRTQFRRPNRDGLFNPQVNVPDAFNVNVAPNTDELKDDAASWLTIFIVLVVVIVASFCGSHVCHGWLIARGLTDED